MTTLAERVAAGERRAVADAVTILERGGSEARELLGRLAPALGRAIVIGITGPPGAGKSTLVNAVIAAWRAAGARVGVIAVDPSSPISGGAILGDRMRMTAALDDDGVYVRSLAAQGALGGLSTAAVRIIDAIDAAGFDRILLETVGTGQNEVDVALIADVRVVVSAPGLGDAVQAIKAGLLEIADVMVVNKADRVGAEETAHSLAAALKLQSCRDTVPVVSTIATLGTGVSDLVHLLESRIAEVAAEPGLERRRRRARYLISRSAVAMTAAAIDAASREDIDRLADAVLEGRQGVEAAARALLMR
jgi:LAO/AO transport system kinase